MRLPFVSILLFALASGCATPPATLPHGHHDKQRLQTRFAQARSLGDLRTMCLATQGLAELGLIKRGDGPQVIAALLGEPQNWTGIYSPGGMSFGYGKETPTVDNSYMFFWFHFQAPESDASDRLLLLHWDDCEATHAK